ncbi:MAG: hypothetical protein M1818_000938 [Claussenomyces sp. TS43310]|nr:MAG: hypothetical protein M1818_000938 [Claussenomyces sp. TS43310]
MAANFVHGRSQGQRHPGTLLDHDSLTRRRQLASNARVKPGAISRPLSHTTPHSMQPDAATSRKYEQHQVFDLDDNQSELWANTTMGDDSDDTTIGTPSSPNRHIDHVDSPPNSATLNPSALRDDHGSPGILAEDAHEDRYESPARDSNQILVGDQPRDDIHGQPLRNLSHRGKSYASRYMDEAPQDFERSNHAPVNVPNVDMGRMFEVYNTFEENPRYKSFQQTTSPQKALQRLTHGQSLSGGSQAAGTQATMPTTQVGKPVTSRSLSSKMNQQGPAPVASLYSYEPQANGDLPISEVDQHRSPALPREDRNDHGHRRDAYPTEQQMSQKNLIDGGRVVDQRELFAASEGESEDASPEVSPYPHSLTATTERSTPIPQSQEKKRHAVELDYDEKVLRSMTYDNLKKQPFEHNPRATPSKIPQELLSSDHPGLEAPLEGRLEYYKSKGIPAAQKQGFFSSLTVEEWDKAGDWFLDRFGNILSDLKEARRAKREISKTFEDEIEKQEQTVRNKAGDLDRDLKDMKIGGQNVLKGKQVI